MNIDDVISTITTNCKNITKIIDLDLLVNTSDKDIFSMIGDLSLKKQNDTLLHCMYSKLSNSRKKLFKFGFNIECINDDLIIIFYKGDVLYDRLYLISPTKIIEFLERASYEDTIICNICNESKYNLLSCTTCVGYFCNICAIKFQNKKCPFCNTDISNYYQCDDNSI